MASLTAGLPSSLPRMEYLSPKNRPAASAIIDQMLVHTNRITSTVTGTDSKLYAVAAKGEAGRSLLIANIGPDTQVETDLPGSFTAYLVDEENYLVQTDLDPKQFLLKENQVIYLEETV